MPIFEKPPLETLTPARERWVPLFLEHGRIEVDDSSVKWIGADRTIMRIPAATISALLLGPGTTITHAAIKACSDCNTPVCWIGADGLHFYAAGVAPTHDNSNARKHSNLHGNRKTRLAIARKMFLYRFPETVVAGKRIDELRGMEGKRVKALYAEKGAKYGVSWKGRNYDPNNWELADSINRSISIANAALYALCTAVICSMGYLPQLGFIHASGQLPFVYDIADMYKPETTLEAAFHAISIDAEADDKSVLAMLKNRIEETGLVRRIPRDLDEIMQ